MGGMEFWYEFGSSYSYPAVMRIERLAREAGVEVRWRPFLLGPIFQTLGWNNSRSNRLIRNVALVVAVLLTIGNIAIPVAVFTGIID